jgi:hypothetical protein
MVSACSSCRFCTVILWDYSSCDAGMSELRTFEVGKYEAGVYIRGGVYELGILRNSVSRSSREINRNKFSSFLKTEGNFFGC